MSPKRRRSTQPLELRRPTPDGRFRRQPTARWSPCVVRHQLPDGSVEVYDIERGATRTVTAEHVEREVRGPRGGRRFVPFTETLESP